MTSGFIEGFFAQDIDRFDIWTGEAEPLGDAPGDLSRTCRRVGGSRSARRRTTPRRWLGDWPCRPRSPTRARTTRAGRRRAASPTSARDCFPAPTTRRRAKTAAYGALDGWPARPACGCAAISSCRTVLGVWACSNPDCKPGEADARRNIGTLYDQPRYRCDECGARVLELLYCETCGDVFLGGYCTEERDMPAWQLFPDSPDLEGIPERARLGEGSDDLPPLLAAA